ncbi:hypothetical protein RJ55_01840 [Drechmeria coniospora]|nr:hypothetical protein RJ55_01840 [Drechmeria coniospora]
MTDPSSLEREPSQTSPALSTASTADLDDDIESSPSLPPLPAPRLPGRVAEILRTPPVDAGEFGTASWGSPYPRTDHNLRRLSLSSEPSDDSPIHHLTIDTPFLRQQVASDPSDTEPQTSISAAAAVLANRVRRQNSRLTEDWIRTHTTGIANAEPKHWFSEGSDSEHSSLSGSEPAWLNDSDARTPKAARKANSQPARPPRYPRAPSSVETLKPGDSFSLKPGEMVDLVTMEESTPVPAWDFPSDSSQGIGKQDSIPEPESSTQPTTEVMNKGPATPVKAVQRPLPEEPAAPARTRKKLPWKGKHIVIMLPRDDQRGQPGKSPMPLRSDEIRKMFESWKELGYGVDGFDLAVDGFQPPDTDDSQSRSGWPAHEDVIQERATGKYPVMLPDLNAWKNYVDELQETKLRALGVFSAEEEPEEPSISPLLTNPSRQPSAQYPPLPFSPPVPASSASSNPAISGYPFPGQLVPISPSPGLSSGASPVPFATGPGQFNSRQSVSLPPAGSAFHRPAQSPPGWPTQAGILHGLSRHEPTSLSNLDGILSPQSPYGLDGLLQAGSPAFNFPQRRQSLQYSPELLGQHPVGAMASPRLPEVHEDIEMFEKSSPERPVLAQPNSDSLQAEIDDAEYHLEEQLRHQLEHEDYSPHTTEDPAAGADAPASPHSRGASADLDVTKSSAHEPVDEPLVLHHPRPHSRGHSLSQNFFRDHGETQAEPARSDVVRPGDLISISESFEIDQSQEMETNLSNFGTPITTFGFTAAPEHQRAFSSTDNPWQEAEPPTSSRRTSHASKPSLSKLNVQAPEFKFNPATSFTPGQFNFSGNFQPAAFQAGHVAGSPSVQSLASQASSSSKFHATAPSFAPSQSDFNFSMSGPKFRPDAPSFTPFQSRFGSAASSAGTGDDGIDKRNSIFGSINFQSNDVAKPAKSSKAIPIVRPSSKSSAKSVLFSTPIDGFSEGPDGRPVNDSRVKRTKSEALNGDDVPLFADRPGTDVSEDEPAEDANDDRRDAERSPRVDTSISSMVALDQMSSQATPFTPSESSPAENANTWSPFEFDSKREAQNFSESRIFGDDTFRLRQSSALSATAASFQPTSAKYEDDQVQYEVVEPVITGASATADSEGSEDKITRNGLEASHITSPSPKLGGLAGSRFARDPSPASSEETEIIRTVEEAPGWQAMQAPVGQPIDISNAREPTFEEIDAVMQHLENDPSMGVNKSKATNSPWQLRSTVDGDSPSHGQQSPVDQLVRDGNNHTPRQLASPSNAAPVVDTELGGSFIIPSISPCSPHPANELTGADIDIASNNWEAPYPHGEHVKLESNSHSFDSRIYEALSSLLASKLDPMEKKLASIQVTMASKSRRTPSLRDVRSISGEIQESDADDEDEEPMTRRSVSPRKDRRMDHIRLAVMDALASQGMAASATGRESLHNEDSVLRALEDIKEHLTASLGTIAEGQAKVSSSGVTSRDMPASVADEQLQSKVDELPTTVGSFEQRLHQEQLKIEKEATERRAAEDAAAELHRKLQAAESRVEAEIINRSVFDQRVLDLEERLRRQEAICEEEIKNKRDAEDRLAEVQRLLKISSEEEDRLKGVVDERDERIRSLEQSSGKSAMRMALLEATQTNSTQSQSEMTKKLSSLEVDLLNVRQDNNHWRSEAEKADEAARRTAGELAQVSEENTRLQKSLIALTTQLEENERLRESWRSKFMSLQEDMGKAAHQVAEENARRVKKDQTMFARQEVLDARLQAEAKTRERLELEMDRLQNNEISGMRAVKECKRLEGLLVELNTENHKLQQAASRYRLEFEEARESGASEVRRTSVALQMEIDTANNQVNVIREELEEQNAKLRAELDNVKLDADTAKAQNEMLLEEAQTTKTTAIDELKRKYDNKMEDAQARFERQVSNAAEDAQRTEQQLLERLSLSSSKIEHLQDRVVHLEDKLEIAREAASAAAQAAKSASVEPGQAREAVQTTQPAMNEPALPEKISPQALRESIMVLQEQLQAREQRIESLEQTVAESDPDAVSKISKRDDEINWLRELLAVRHADLQDIITALSGDNDGVEREAVRDAAIRLKANLQMEQQERERAANGGSSISLPNLAQSIQAATPRVAQAVGPIAAAWGNWRKSNQPAFRSLSAALNSPTGTNRTPSKSRGGPSSQSLLGGLLTPPASGPRQASLMEGGRPQPTAFSSTGRRYTSQGGVPRHVRGGSMASFRSDQMPAAQEMSFQERREQPQTPPMARKSGYDSDAQPGDFDDHDFFEDD